MQAKVRCSIIMCQAMLRNQAVGEQAGDSPDGVFFSFYV